MYNICCIGHITSDKVVTPESVTYMPGGTALYFSCAISQMPVSYLLLTSLAELEMGYVNDLRTKHIEVLVQPGRHTVFFENIYTHNPDERSQNVLQTADAFDVAAVQTVDAGIYHLGPLLAGDISLEFIKALAAKGRVSLDVQGYLRRVANQKVYPNDWAQKQEALQYVAIVKADVAELQTLTGCADVKDGIKTLAGWGVHEIVITNGSKGSVIWHDGVFYNIPAYHPAVVVDATGCGDTYMAGYLYKRTKGAGIQQAGEFAAAISGLKTAKRGPFDGTEQEVIAFMNRTV
jgi:sugar/nucleoside kinase (ribokinase family)